MGAGELVYQFTRLVQGAGGLGQALTLLGDVAREVWARITLGVQGMALMVTARWQEITWAITSALDTALQAVVTFANGAINSFQGAMDAIREIWGALPGSIGDLAFQAANALIGAVEAMLNGVGQRINGFLASINSGLETLGVERRIALIGDLALGRLDNPFEGAAQDAGARPRPDVAACWLDNTLWLPARYGGQSGYVAGRFLAE